MRDQEREKKKRKKKRDSEGLAKNETEGEHKLQESEGREGDEGAERRGSCDTTSRGGVAKAHNGSL